MPNSVSHTEDVQQRNVALLQGFEDSFVAGDIEDVLARLHDDIVVHEAANLPYPGDHAGKDGFLALANAFDRTWEITAPIRLDIAPVGDDRVLVLVELDVVGRPTGMPLTLRITELYTIAGGLITDVRVSYWDTLEVMRAANGEVVLRGTGPAVEAEQRSALEVARRFESAVLVDGDLDAAMDFAHPELTIREPPGMPYENCYVGRQGLEGLLNDVGGVWNFLDGPHISFHASAHDASRIFTRVEGRAVLVGTEVERQFLVTEWLTVRDGMVTDIEVFYWDHAPILAAAGL